MRERKSGQGYFELTCEVSGKDIEKLSNEAGGHRIQRVPPTERRGRVHTSTITVSVLRYGEMQDVAQEYSYRWFSGTGAGGQHRNKHQNCLELTHLPTGLKQSANGRDRASNEAYAKAEIEKKIEALYRSEASGAANRTRASQIGSGMRGDKRRTYRFQDDSVSDHVAGKAAACSRVMRGDFALLW